MIAAFDYATPSVFTSNREQALLGMSANARRPVRFHGRVTRNVPLLRFTLRTLGETIWSNDHWQSSGEYVANILDPVITVHPDRIFFEAFSQDQSVYATVIASPDMFQTEGDVALGTTNVDFSAWLWAALNELRSSRETWLRIEAAGFEVATAKAGGRFQQKVELPDPWVRGFLQVTGGMALPGTRVTVQPADLLAAIRYLRYTKAKLSPRALRYEFLPGQDARLVLEPWEHVVPLRRAEHNYTEPRTIRTWGRRRLSLIEGLLPFATSVDIYLKGRALPSFYALKMPDLTFVLGLSGWSDNAWTDAGGFDLLGEPATADDTSIAKVHAELASRFHGTAKELGQALGQSPDVIWRACERLCRQGRAMFDVETRGFRHRELFEQPIDEKKFFPPDERPERARKFIAESSVRVNTCQMEETRKVKNLKSLEGWLTREIVYRDWRVVGSAGDQPKVEIVVNDTGRIIFGSCGCRFFQEHTLSKGPCEHMIALFAVSADLRKDLPTSVAASAVPPKPPRIDSEEGEKEVEDEEDNVDEEGEDEKHERR